MKKVDVKNGSAEGVLFIMFIDKYGYNSNMDQFFEGCYIKFIAILKQEFVKDEISLWAQWHFTHPIFD